MSDESNVKKEVEPVDSRLVGTWLFESSQNLENVMKELGANIFFRKAANLSRPTIHISVDGDKWSIKAYSTFKNVINENITIDQQFDDGILNFKKFKLIHQIFRYFSLKLVLMALKLQILFVGHHKTPMSSSMRRDFEKMVQ
jgi:hypothetical protein